MRRPTAGRTSLPARPALRALRGSLGSLVTPQVELAVGLALAALWRLRRRGQGREHLLLCPPGTGNIGDEALVRAFLHNVQGPVVLLTSQAEGSGGLREDFGERVTSVSTPGLLYGPPRRHVRALWRLLPLLRRARSLSVVGADVMDGAYDPVPSARRANIATVARTLGADVRVLGFSWGPHTGDTVRAAMRRAERAGVRLLVRDPVSADNLRAAGVSSLVECADMAFADPTLAEVECTRKLAGVAPGVERFALVNVSGLLSQPGQLSSYQAVVAHLRERGLAALVVPHVSRPGIDDIAAGRALCSEFAGDPGVMMVDTLWSPAEIRSLTRRAQLVVTGRMHLGVLALSQGTPALILDSKGKVPGLLGLFGRPEWCLASHSDLRARGPELIDAILGEEELHEQLLVTAGSVRVLAERNFEGLGEGGEGPVTPPSEPVSEGASTPDAPRCPSRSGYSA